MEAEYVALAEIGKRIEAFRHFLVDIRFGQKKATVIYEDNKSCINLAKAPKFPANQGTSTPAITTSDFL
jgi:hypothetical protein